MRAINTLLTLKILANCQMSTGSLMTRQTYDRAPRLTKLVTAHISKGENDIQCIHKIYCVIDSDIYYTNISKSNTFNTYYFINLHAKLA